MAVLPCAVFSINDQQGGDNSTVEVPLLNNQNMPLVAMFDTTNLNKAVKSYIKTTVDECTEEKIPQIKDTILDVIGYEPGRQQERPAFTASLTTGILFSTSGSEVIVFDKVWLNSGNVYDKNTGVFTIPRTGLYMISATVTSTRNKYLHCHLWKDNEELLGIFGTGLSTGTINPVMALSKGTRIYVKHDSNRINEFILGVQYSMFSGLLLSEGWSTN